MGLFKKKQEDGEKGAHKKDDLRDSAIEEFVPYSCHVDPHTILTKNGEVLQVIKITGFNFETVEEQDHTHASLREVIRNSIKKSITDDGYALTIHTVRRKRDLSTEGEYQEVFADLLNKMWVDYHNLRDNYMNELYITIMREGASLKLTNLEVAMRSMHMGKEQAARIKEIDDSISELSRVTESIMQDLKMFGARLLGVQKGSDGYYYSDIMRFLGKILNLHEEPFPLKCEDLAEEVVEQHDIAFGFNLMKVRGEKGSHYAAMLTVKEYHEFTTRYIDEFLQLPHEFVITELFDFIKNDIVLNYYKKLLDFHKAGNDEHLNAYSGLEAFVDANTGSKTDYGEHQISIMLIGDTPDELEENVSDMSKSLRDLGIIAFREDMYLEHCFWSQLPGNFAFVERMTYIPTSHIGGYASLYNFPAGRLDGNHWGPAVTMFYTAQRTPYFFNFHYEDNGHTTIIGPYGAGKTVLLNFILGESRKFGGKLFFFDIDRGSEIFIKSLGGLYRRVLRDSDKTQLRMNPLSIEDNSLNRIFLSAFFLHLLVEDPADLTAEDAEKIRQVVEWIFQLPKEQRQLRNVIPKFWPYQGAGDDIVQKISDESAIDGYRLEIKTNDTNARMSLWHSGGVFAHLFDNEQDDLHTEEGLVHGFGFTHMVEDKVTQIPVLSYILHRVRESLDGSPSMLVLDEAWRMIDNSVFAPHLEELLDEFRMRNTVIIFATESAEDASKSSITETLTNKIQTRIFLPNPDATGAYISVFGLSEEEVEFIQTMKREKRQFLIKHHADSVVAELNLQDMDDLLAVLSAKPGYVELMEEVITEKGDNPEHWVHVYMRKAQRMIKEKRKADEEKRRIEEAQEARRKILEKLGDDAPPELLREFLGEDSETEMENVS